MPNDIEKIPLFEVTLHSVKLPDFEAHRQGLLAAITEKQSREPGSVDRSNRGNCWHSREDLHADPHPDVQWAVMQLLGAARFLTHVQDKSAKLALTAMWANVSGMGGFNGPHHHAYSYLSGVLYVDAGGAAPGGAAPIEFISPVPLAQSYGLPHAYEVAPEDGRALFFPGFLLHHVHPNMTSRKRVSISFNLANTAG